LISTLTTEGRTMRAELLLGFVMIAAAAPLCAQADAVSKADLWNSWRAGPIAALDALRTDPARSDEASVARVPLAMHEQAATDARTVGQSDAAAAAMGELAARKTRMIRAVDTNMPRVFVAGTARMTSAATFSVPRLMTASATTAPSRAVQVTAVPEMNAGLAAAGLTLLLGGVAVLRSGRARSNS
jgi:hypothetical protein